MAGKRQTRSKLIVADEAGEGVARRRNQINLFDLAYERIEDLIVQCELTPGRFLAMQDLQEMTGFGRTPVHQAVTRLAADTLVTIRPRHGVKIAPIDLARERVLLRLRRDLERFVIQLATERSGPSHRNQMLHITRLLREKRAEIGIDKFNSFDRRIDRLITTAAGEPFLEHSLRPLHTIFRRIGWIYHTQIAGAINLDRSIDCHLAILEAVANRHAEQAMAASDELIGFVDLMFGVLEREVDPALLDSSLTPLEVG
jgi:DNA-binding GntR family transcriptional regulator